MSAKPRLLDLFCGVGGAGAGYARAGFEVVGVDIANEVRNPHEFVRADALAYLEEHGHEFDVIHASPPCQVFTRARHLREAQGRTTSKPDLLEPTRRLLRATGKPYVIENVPGAPLVAPLVLCGSMFGLQVRRHRLFEVGGGAVLPEPPPCQHRAQGRPVGVYHAMGDQVKGVNRANGKMVYGGRTAGSLEEARLAMGMDWGLWPDLVEAIPPAYTEWVGRHLVEGREGPLVLW